MKVLLVQPPIRDFYQTWVRTQPIGLAYLAASLQFHGHQVEILDCQTKNKKSISIPPEFSYLQKCYLFKDLSPFRLYTDYYHFGMNWKEIRQKIEDSKADVFGISSSFTPYHQEALEIARIIKGWDSEKMVIMGGPHISCDSENVLRSPFVDYIVLGEGEIRFPLLLRQIEQGRDGSIGEIDGVGYRWNGKIHIHPLQSFIHDLDSLPYPARELLDLDRYRVKKRRSTMMITSRGCPHRCAYCSAHLVMGASFRTRSPKSVIQEMIACRSQYDVQIFDIEDDNFTFDKNRAKRLMGLIIETFGEGTITLCAMNGVSFASLDKELLRLMKRAGFEAINLSFVSTDTFIKDRMGRPGATNDFDRVLKDAAQVDLNVIAYAILGIPGQTIEEMVDTIIYLMDKRVLIGPSVYYPTPGTPLFKECKELGILPSNPSQWRSSALPIETKHFDRLDILTLFRLARVINFMKRKMDERELDEGMTWREILQFIKDRGKAGGQIQAAFYSPWDLGFMPYGKADAMTWTDLLLLISQERSFFSLEGNPEGRISVFKVKSSKKILDYFFEKAWEKPVLKSRNN